MIKRMILLAGVLLSLSSWAVPLGTGFSYQGELLNNGSPANGEFDFELTLYDALNAGSQVGLVVNVEDVQVNNGLFSVELDFGFSPYDGDQLWMLTSVRTGASGGAFTELLPRQKLTPTPFALRAESVAENSVGVAEILPNSVGSSELIETDAYTINGLINTGSTVFQSGSDIRIHDNFNGFRWYDGAGVIQYANFVIGSASVSFSDSNQGRTIITSDSNGIGVGGGSSSGYAVTMPSLNVTGQTKVGYIRVSTSYALDLTNVDCHSHGNLTCYYGSGNAVCPVGTRVLGGGSDGTSSARFGSLSRSYPSNTTTWACSSSYDIAGASDSCYAICGRLE